MPLMKIDLLSGKTDAELKQLLDLSYQAMLETLGIPEGDRYQVITQHEPSEMVVLDTGLGFERSENKMIFSLTSRPRTTEQKQAFYRRLVTLLHQELNISTKDILINFVINDDEDWSFKDGEAQFLTGELS
ncbi:tautomerase family protein [Agrilactobacillus yilanensis]|uniref:Tautomerase family protein n=1 Tax=Agrilactobacillus yilanensis TaxID=2485997 RepID=A0ABW4J3C0_9LACO|nr:tautomerase family protein [Agrilactobacillus yilanensis]